MGFRQLTSQMTRQRISKMLNQPKLNTKINNTLSLDDLHHIDKIDISEKKPTEDLWI